MREAVAAFGAAASQYPLAGTASHTFHKAVSAASFALFGLVGLFRHIYSGKFDNNNPQILTGFPLIANFFPHINRWLRLVCISFPFAAWSLVTM